MDKISILMPFDGYVAPISESANYAFKNQMIGDGIFLKPRDREGFEKILAPMDGEIKFNHSMPHIMIFSNEHFDLLMHIGNNNANVAGKGFGFYVLPGEKVKAGDVIGFVDLGFLSYYSSLESAIAIKNVNNKEIHLDFNYKALYAKDVIIEATV